MSLVLGIFSGVSGALLGAWSRSRAPAPLVEAVPRSSIADLAPGRFSIRGRVIPIETEASAIDDARCVYVERVEVGRERLAPTLEHAIVTHRFILEDESGRIQVDPDRVLCELATIRDDSGRVAERRVRAGEEIELVCEIRAAHGGSGEEVAVPYRHDAAHVAIDYDAPSSPPILRDTIDTRGLELEPRPLSRMAAGAAGAVLSAWGVVLVLWSFAFAG